jgi:simple sugar transport system permease protein
VLRTRYLAVIASGALSALGGVYLSIGLLSAFSQNMTAGRGFIALAAVIFGSWRPYGALAGALLFGFSSAVARRLPAFSESTAVLFEALPYVLTLVVVAGVIGRSRPPAAIGVPYVKE